MILLYISPPSRPHTYLLISLWLELPIPHYSPVYMDPRFYTATCGSTLLADTLSLINWVSNSWTLDSTSFLCLGLRGAGPCSTSYTSRINAAVLLTVWASNSFPEGKLTNSAPEHLSIHHHNWRWILPLSVSLGTRIWSYPRLVYIPKVILHTL